MDAVEFQQMLAGVSVPDAPDIMPENDLHPDPQRLAFEFSLLRSEVIALTRRLEKLENERNIRDGC